MQYTISFTIQKEDIPAYPGSLTSYSNRVVSDGTNTNTAANPEFDSHMQLIYDPARMPVGSEYLPFLGRVHFTLSWDDPNAGGKMFRTFYTECTNSSDQDQIEIYYADGHTRSMERQDGLANGLSQRRKIRFPNRQPFCLWASGLSAFQANANFKKTIEPLLPRCFYLLPWRFLIPFRRAINPLSGDKAPASIRIYAFYNEPADEKRSASLRQWIHCRPQRSGLRRSIGIPVPGAAV